ncbi:prepilin-type N-terminal cleavage/methylation domain-containing protein [Phycisphaerales bacterium AB-hyl4]|uniref:Prepilin-type N-terminal cleavage/methylation domain-containing protein n=1 Tax=Natronomicrosphaera hydrolytica TaxID=3242702 RepID=A0ABV4UAK5_9BACT
MNNVQLRNSKSEIRNRVKAFSLVEMLIALAITAMLLTATMVAIDVSFRAYAAAAESAGTQTATRLVTHRLLTLVRTSTAHGPTLPDTSSEPPVVYFVRDNGQVDPSILVTNYIELFDTQGRRIRIEYQEEDKQLLLTTNYGGSNANTQPLLGGVTQCKFYAHRRQDNEGVWVLERASMDITVEPDRDSTLAIESSQTQPVRYVASTMPRKLE